MITLTTEKLDYYRGLIESSFTSEERDQNAQSLIRYAFNKWVKSFSKSYQETKQKFTDQLDDFNMETQINLAIKQENGAVLKKDGEIQFKADDEIVYQRTLREKSKEINDLFRSEMVSFEPYLFLDNTEAKRQRILKMDPFIREELAGIFIPEHYVNAESQLEQLQSNQV